MNFKRPDFHRLLCSAHRSFFALLLLAAGALHTSAGAQSSPLLDFGTRAASPSSVVTTDQVRAELLAWAPNGVAVGKQVWVGLQLTHQNEWHTYWKNAGDSGLSTTLDWQLPAGVTAGDIAWPTPKKIPLGTLANYGYEGTVLLPVPLTVANTFNAAQLNLLLHASWLVCRKECIPQSGDFALSLPANSSTAASSAAFAATFAATPIATAAGRSTVVVAGQALTVSLTSLPAALQGKTLAVYPETGAITEPAAAYPQGWANGVWTASLPLSAQRTASPARLSLVVAQGKDAARLDLPVTGVWPPAIPPAPVSPALAAALAANTLPGATAGQPGSALAVPITFWAALLGALVGGMILNLMPCVFPVLAIKVVGFVKVQDQRSRARCGLAYSVGVMLSFLALGALLLGLRAAGESLGWGFQLQSPAVVASLAVLFTLMGLNLAGLFEFGHFLPSRIASVQAKNPTVDALLSGVLATAIASPCTAPFMGASLGFAVGLPAVQALAIFGAIGMGMALPYLVASTVPAVARALPRPGAWMVTFKQSMAFPMFATVAWLVWVLGQQSGIDGAGALLGLLVLLALALWALSLTGRTRTIFAVLSIAMLAAGVWAIGANVLKTPDTTAVSNAPGTRWQTWAPGRVEQLTAEGHSVFVDFTAAWCVTCQYNKKTTLANADVLGDIDAKKVVLLRADWTRRDPAVTAALSQLGRSGVPVYVLYKPGRAPVVLSEVLSVGDVRAELAKL